MCRVIGQSGISHRVHLGVRLQSCRQRVRACAHALKANFEGLQAAQHLPGLERSDDRAGHLAPVAHSRCQLDARRRDVPEQDIGMARDALGVGDHDQVCSERERSLAQRRSGCVVDRHQRAFGVCAPSHCRDVGQFQHRIGRRLDPDQPITREIGAAQLDRRAAFDPHRERREKFFCQRARRVVAVGRQQNAIARAQGREKNSGHRRHARRKDHRFGTLQMGQRILERVPGRI